MIVDLHCRLDLESLKRTHLRVSNMFHIYYFNDEEIKICIKRLCKNKVSKNIKYRHSDLSLFTCIHLYIILFFANINKSKVAFTVQKMF